jgi:hypothetical protein
MPTSWVKQWRTKGPAPGPQQGAVRASLSADNSDFLDLDQEGPAQPNR